MDQCVWFCTTVQERESLYLFQVRAFICVLVVIFIGKPSKDENDIDYIYYTKLKTLRVHLGYQDLVPSLENVSCTEGQVHQDNANGVISTPNETLNSDETCLETELVLDGENEAIGVNEDVRLDEVGQEVRLDEDEVG